MTGRELQDERRRERLSAREVALAAGVARQRITGIEAMALVPPAWIERYREAMVKALAAKEPAA